MTRTQLISKIIRLYNSNLPLSTGTVEAVTRSNCKSLYVFEAKSGIGSLPSPTLGKNAREYLIEEGERKYIQLIKFLWSKGLFRNVTSHFVKPIAVTKKMKTTLPKVSLKEVFIVHGKDDKEALLLQKYIRDKLKINAILFDDLPDKGKTIIEQLEYIRNNIGYAFVIATPDDVGCLAENIEKLGTMLVGTKNVSTETVKKIFEMLRTRARQNVVFELGLFMGALGRDKVCCLLKCGTEERPSDIDGILYKPFEKSVKEVFHEIPEELKEAGLIK